MNLSHLCVYVIIDLSREDSNVHYFGLYYRDKLLKSDEER